MTLPGNAAASLSKSDARDSQGFSTAMFLVKRNFFLTVSK